jgi:hypothetical protein
MLKNPDHPVRHFRDILLWPIQIHPAFTAANAPAIRAVLAGSEGPSPWQPVVDEFTDDPSAFQERHYREFISFQPFVQRVLYGEGRSGRRDAPPAAAAPMETYRRHDVAALRVILRPDDAPILLQVAHVDLYLFLDLDVALLNVEVYADDLDLRTALELIHRFGRAYPAGWDFHGQGLHNAFRTELLGAAGEVLSSSDLDCRERYLEYVCRHRAPYLAPHWAYLLKPMILDHDDTPGLLRFHQIEYYRMPLMALLGLDNPRALAREDMVHIGLASHTRPRDPLPLQDPAVAQFESLYCDDRYWTDTECGPNTRFICTGNALIALGEGNSEYFMNADHGLLSQFRHQYFLLFLIAHLHRAALLSFSDGLAEAINGLDVREVDSVKVFKRRIRLIFETFLRFTHRYWFHEVSERGQVQSLFRMTANHLRNDSLFDDVREQVEDMDRYLEADTNRRQSNTVVRLTVVTALGLIGTVVTGYFGMNLFNFMEEVSFTQRFIHLAVTIVSTSLLVMWAIARSKRLSDFLEALSDERQDFRAKLASFGRIFWQGKE